MSYSHVRTLRAVQIFVIQLPCQKIKMMNSIQLVQTTARSTHLSIHESSANAQCGSSEESSIDGYEYEYNIVE